MKYFDYLGTNNTNERTNLLRKIQKLIESYQIKNDELLDIGIGCGDVTTPLSKRFKHTTIIEPDGKNIKRILKVNKKINFVRSKLEQVDFDKIHNRYNFILCSHMLCFIERKEIGRIIDRLFALLASNGILVIGINDPDSELIKFYHKFWNSVPDKILKFYDEKFIIKTAKRSFRKVNTYKVPAQIFAKKFDHLCYLLFSFLGATDCKYYQKIKDRIIDFAKKHSQIKHDIINFNLNTILIVIKKI